MMKQWQCSGALALLLALAAPVSAQPGRLADSGANPPGPSDNRVHPMAIKIRSSMRPGDVIARGNRGDANRNGRVEDGECYFDFGISIELESGSRRVDLRKGPDCTMVLEDIRDEGVVEPLGVARGNTAPSRGPVAILLARLWESIFPRVHAQSYPYKKGLYGHIYSWGIGGANFDGHTAQQGWTEWEYDGFNAARATMMHGWYCHSQTCQYPLVPGAPMGPNTGWNTVQPLGFNFVIWGPVTNGSGVGRHDYSSYRYNPNSFNHTLTLKHYGTGNGQASCDGYYSGWVVSGVTEQCWTYTPPWPYF